jgi:hypothetical protein
VRTLPRVGDVVDVHDPLGYSGHGRVTKVQIRPHHAVVVKMYSITDRTDQRMVGREASFLASHVSIKTAYVDG